MSVKFDCKMMKITLNIHNFKNVFVTVTENVSIELGRS